MCVNRIEKQEAIEWLVSAGMLNRVCNVSKMEHPLSVFDKMDQFKGPLTENYVLQQLRGQFNVEPRYFSDKNNEIDFVLQYGTEIIPVEAKGGEDKSAPSFKKYVNDHQPDYALRYSKRRYITNLPLYLARKTRELL